MNDRFEIANHFEKHNFWETPIWIIEFKDKLNNNKIKESALELEFIERNGNLFLESTVTPILSYSSIAKEMYKALYSIPFNPALLKIRDFKPKFYICKPDGCSVLADSCENTNGQEVDLIVLYFVNVPKKSIPIVSFKDPRMLIEANSFFRNHYGSDSVSEFEPSEGCMMAFPSYLRYNITPNFSDDNLIYFKAALSLATMNEVERGVG